MRRNRNKSNFIQPNLFRLHWNGFGDGTTFRSHCRVVSSTCCFCFDPSTRCRRRQSGFSAEPLPPLLTNNRETQNVTEHAPRSLPPKGSASVSHPIDTSHAHTRTRPGFLSNANRLLCYVIAGAAERLNKPRLSRPRPTIAGTDEDADKFNSIQFNPSKPWST